MIIDKEDCKHILHAIVGVEDQGQMDMEQALIVIKIMDKYNGLNDRLLREACLRTIAHYEEKHERTH